ncbi:MAG TPA: glycosyltransferase, partial [Pyrinomonadaceae bacterium]
IETALRSIIKQSLAPAELIVIDDGSTDNSTSIIDLVLRQCSFPCELIARENRGLCATLNEGLARAQSEYFAYLGSDDLWLPGFLKARAELLDDRPAAVLAYGHAYFVDEENRVVDCTADWANYVDGDARQMLLSTIAPMSPTVVYHREALARHGWNEAARLEDYELYLRLCAEGEFAFDPRALSAWRRHRTNVSWDQKLMLAEQLKAQREAAQRFGLTESEISKLQTVTRFQRAEDFLRIGDKPQALRLMLKNISGVRSVSSLARMLFRLGTPFSLMGRYHEAKARKTEERVGRLSI